MPYKKLIQDRIDELGLTRAEVARRANLGPTAIRDIVDREHSPSVDTLRKIAQVLGLRLAQLVDDRENVTLSLKVDGLALESSMWTPLSDRHARLIPLNFLSSDTVSVEIGSNAWEPAYRRGDVVSGSRHRGPTWHNLIGNDVIAEADDGRRFIGILAAGREPGGYDVRSHDPRDPGVRDVRLAWVAPIRMIIRST